ncbi:MAG: undecaprenyl-diphosphatase UppP [Gemmatimonadota bacterium]|nr:undecaprenyl-diphosphatase UppP [Gemmatimonadota bacterium]
MTLLQSLILGILQGLAEFLPISSSAHLTLAPWIFGWADPGLAFDVALHAGTLVALAWYFRRDWVELTMAAFAIIRTRRVQSPVERRVILLIIATIPGAIAGKLLNDYAEQTFRAPELIAGTLIVMGALLWAADKWTPQVRNIDEVSKRDAILIGLAQMFALIPGVSRSGSTITAGRALGLQRDAAARFSFLMSMPITAAAVIVKLPQAIHTQPELMPIIVGIIAAAVSGWLAISVLLHYIAKHSFGMFALYRLALGIFVLALAASRR